MPALLNLIIEGFQKAYNLPTIRSELSSTRALALAPVVGDHYVDFSSSPLTF